MTHAAGQARPPWRERLAFHAVMLGAMALLASAALTFGNRFTAPDIRDRYAEDLRASLRQVIPSDAHDNDLLQHTVTVNDSDGRPVHVYVATKEGKTTAVAFQKVGQGYGGPIHLMLGVDRDGRLLGVRVISHSETPGLGDNIELSKTDWILGFNGLSLANTPEKEWHVKKDGGRFDQFSGATITPRAVVKAVHEGLEFFARYRTRLLNDASPLAPVKGGTS
ncbi:MAG: electron transport complex subunit RsxG [Gammaproteobacteria bacterium]